MTTPTDIAALRKSWIPDYHFYAPEFHHYPFDPNGAIFWKGRYHVFYLFDDPNVGNRGQTHWGHASSTDLVNWHFHPAAIKAEEPGELAIFSGCALLDKSGRPVLVYFGVDCGICLAYPEDDDLNVWRKSEANPVIPLHRGRASDVYNVFDPHVWLEGDTYYAILGGKVLPYMEYDTAYLFRSDDLVHWEYMRPFYQPSDRFTKKYDDCACPDFFTLDGAHYLLCISHARGARYYVGDCIDHTFVPREHHWLNLPGGALFAPETLLDDQNRRIAFFWMIGSMPEPPPRNIWSLPRVFRRDPADHRLLQFVPEEFAMLHGEAKDFGAFTARPGESLNLADDARACRIEIEATVPDDGVLEFRLLAQSDGSEAVHVRYRRAPGILEIDRSRTKYQQVADPILCNLGTAPTGGVLTTQTAPWELAADGILRLHIYVDHCIVEVFSPDGVNAVSQLAYPDIGCAHASMAATGAPVEIRQCRIRPMKKAAMDFTASGFAAP